MNKLITLYLSLPLSSSLFVEVNTELSESRGSRRVNHTHLSTESLFPVSPSAAEMSTCQSTKMKLHTSTEKYWGQWLSNKSILDQRVFYWNHDNFHWLGPKFLGSHVAGRRGWHFCPSSQTGSRKTAPEAKKREKKRREQKKVNK